jgi:hypothetical protein
MHEEALPFVISGAIIGNLVKIEAVFCGYDGRDGQVTIVIPGGREWPDQILTMDAETFESVAVLSNTA